MNIKSRGFALILSKVSHRRVFLSGSESYRRLSLNDRQPNIRHADLAWIGWSVIKTQTVGYQAACLLVRAISDPLHGSLVFKVVDLFSDGGGRVYNPSLTQTLCLLICDRTQTV